ncbi:MAG TPA: elongation factor P [Firmicutes bacterium]|nr:elongation factor P [Bacillota bacterium]HAW71918.1 elongation factor P [Bacillota bacterium]HBE06271.1 elongation factor P [Bacillota bacterium]HBL50779.1 elongation factor P [Bacillota bacterium]HBL67489.1 elongation factor P [Bacillota bacterium]
MISVNDLRTGLTIELDGDVYAVVDFLHVKPGKGAAFVRTKLRNVRTGFVVERTFNAGEKVPPARVETRDMQYLYASDNLFTFMDTESYDQIALPEEKLGDAVKFLKENMTISVQMYQGEAIGIQLPNTVELEVVETDPGLKGDTAAGGTKPATLETGAIVNVPLFINIGDVIAVDTRSKEYLKRASK